MSYMPQLQGPVFPVKAGKGLFKQCPSGFFFFFLEKFLFSRLWAKVIQMFSELTEIDSSQEGEGINLVGPSPGP